MSDDEDRLDADTTTHINRRNFGAKSGVTNVQAHNLANYYYYYCSFGVSRRKRPHTHAIEKVINQYIISAVCTLQQSFGSVCMTTHKTTHKTTGKPFRSAIDQQRPIQKHTHTHDGTKEKRAMKCNENYKRTERMAADTVHT